MSEVKESIFLEPALVSYHFRSNRKAMLETSAIPQNTEGLKNAIQILRITGHYELERLIGVV
jgi:hypothetical protein